MKTLCQAIMVAPIPNLLFSERENFGTTLDVCNLILFSSVFYVQMLQKAI